MKKPKNSSKKPVIASNKSIKKIDKPREILGVVIFGTRKSEALRKIWLQRKEMLHVATVNPEYIMEARHNEKFKNVLAECLTVADGHGIVWASELQAESRKLKVERISGIELVDEILSHASKNSQKVFLLGAREGVGEKAAQEMSKKYPGLQISSYSGAKSVSEEKNEEASMTIAKINGVSPDYLLVAYGSPYQDLWIEENRPYLRTRVAMGVGGALDEWAGIVKICPDWIDKLGMKWVWRVAHEPRRIMRIVKVLQFGILVLYHKLID